VRTWFVVVALVMFRDVAAEPTPPLAPDVPPKYVEVKPGADFERREVMIPMRDGIKLHTVLMIPKGATKAPIMLTRTPYNASKRTDRTPSTSISVSLGVGDDVIAADPRYIRAFQDVRGKYGSEGDYVMTRPLRGPLNDSKVDHSTDAYDTIDWLVKNVPETNGKVGMIGSSYEGFTVLMALVHPHPALRVAVPMSPMVDGWKGDDWFHNGAFRQTNFDYFAHQTVEKGEGKHISRTDYDDYEAFRRAGSAGDFAKLYGLDQLPYWKKISEHPAYDAYWQGQALDQILAKVPVHEACHGFVTGRSTVTNAKPHEGAAIVIKLDLKDFFPTVHYRRVRGLFKNLGYNEQVAGLLAGLTTYRPKVGDTVVWPGVLPQGAPTSPALANLACRRLDRRLGRLADKYGATYTRYADDLTFSFAKQPEVKLGRLLWWIDGICQQEGFVERPDKRRILRNKHQQRVTGLVVNAGVHVPRADRKRFRAILHNCKKNGVASQARGNADFGAYLAGFAAYVHMVEPALGKRWIAEVDQLLGDGHG